MRLSHSFARYELLHHDDDPLLTVNRFKRARRLFLKTVSETNIHRFETEITGR